jgi:hypothetical protein
MIPGFGGKGYWRQGDSNSTILASLFLPACGHLDRAA